MSKKNKDKKVSNLLEEVARIRDLLDDGDIKKIFSNKYWLEKCKDDIIRHVKKYILSETHQCDFNHEDIRALADGIFKIDKKLIPIKYTQAIKMLEEKSPITDEIYNNFAEKVSDRIFYDAKIKPIANDLSYFACTFYLWSQSEWRKPILEQLEETIRSFL